MRKRVRDLKSGSQQVDECAYLNHRYLQVSSVAAQESGFDELGPGDDPGIARPGADDGRVCPPATLSAIQPIVECPLRNAQEPGGLGFAEKLPV